MEDSLEQSPEFVSDRRSARSTIPAQERLNPLPHVGADYRLVLTVVDFVLVAKLSNVGDVGQQLVNTGLREPLPAAFDSFLGGPPFIDPSALVQFGDHRQQRLVFRIEIEDGPHTVSLGLIDHKF
jgi:hypothetical protein